MSTSFTFNYPTPSGNSTMILETGTTTIIVGANGSGKSRLAVQLEETITNTHRISGHRGLSLNPQVPKINTAHAENILRNGEVRGNYRRGARWQENPATYLLNDFDALLQTLFAEQNTTALKSHEKLMSGSREPGENTRFEKLRGIWERLLPHRKLIITSDDIQASDLSMGNVYSASEMSDGERAVFYLIGQVLCAESDSILIFDEPELHLHQAIMSKLWDELEAIRKDCAFVLITHDLEFAAGRQANKFVIESYTGNPLGWTISEVPEDGYFDEALVTLILGSRKPILFVEGTRDSFDISIYRACYPEWTVICRSSCQEVIHAVITLNGNPNFTRTTTCGLIDLDGKSSEEISWLNGKNIFVLPVSEVENFFLLPDVVRSIAEIENYNSEQQNVLVEKVTDEVINNIRAGNNLENCIVRHCKRTVDAALKRVDFGTGNSVPELAAKVGEELRKLDIELIGNELRENLENAISNRDLSAILSMYDNKGLLDIVASNTKNIKAKKFKEWVQRTLSSKDQNHLKDIFMTVLPGLP